MLQVSETASVLQAPRGSITISACPVLAAETSS